MLIHYITLFADINIVCVSFKSFTSLRTRAQKTILIDIYWMLNHNKWICCKTILLSIALLCLILILTYLFKVLALNFPVFPIAKSCFWSIETSFSIFSSSWNGNFERQTSRAKPIFCKEIVLRQYEREYYKPDKLIPAWGSLLCRGAEP